MLSYVNYISAKRKLNGKRPCDYKKIIPKMKYLKYPDRTVIDLGIDFGDREHKFDA